MARSCAPGHVAHYLAWAEACDAESQRTGEGTGPSSRIDLERENLLRAIDACIHDDIPDGAASGLRLLAALRRYWLARGLGRLGAELGLAMLARSEGLPVEAPRIVVGYITAYLLWVSDRLDEAHRVALQAVALAEAAGDRAGLAAAQLELGTIKRNMGAQEEGQAAHETTCRIALEIGDRNLYADALCRMGNSAAIDGRLQDAARYFDEALPIRMASGHAWRMAGVLLFAGTLAIRLQRRQRARDLLRQVSAVLPRVGSVQYEQYLVDGTAQLATLEGEWPLVVRLCAGTSALPHSASAGPPVQGHDEQARHALLNAARAALDAADFDKAWSLGLATSIQQALALARDWLGADAATDGRPVCSAGGRCRPASAPAERWRETQSSRRW